MRGGGAAARLVECARPGLVRRGQPDVAPGGPSCGHPGLPAARRSSPARTAPPAARVVRFSVHYVKSSAHQIETRGFTVMYDSQFTWYLDVNDFLKFASGHYETMFQELVWLSMACLWPCCSRQVYLLLKKLHDGKLLPIISEKKCMLIQFRKCYWQLRASLVQIRELRFLLRVL
jgi:hypothetical protein